MSRQNKSYFNSKQKDNARRRKSFPSEPPATLKHAGTIFIERLHAVHVSKQHEDLTLDVRGKRGFLLERGGLSWMMTGQEFIVAVSIFDFQIQKITYLGNYNYNFTIRLISQGSEMYVRVVDHISNCVSLLIEGKSLSRIAKSGKNCHEGTLISICTICCLALITACVFYRNKKIKLYFCHEISQRYTSLPHSNGCNGSFNRWNNIPGNTKRPVVSFSFLFWCSSSLADVRAIRVGFGARKGGCRILLARIGWFLNAFEPNLTKGNGSLAAFVGCDIRSLMMFHVTGESIN